MTIPPGSAAGQTPAGQRVSVASTSKAPISALPHSSDTAGRRAARNAPYAAPSGPQNPGCRRRRRWPRSAAPARKSAAPSAAADVRRGRWRSGRQQRHVRRPGGTEQDDGPGQRPAKATASSGRVAACRLPASQIIAVCTSRTSAVVIKMPTAAARLRRRRCQLK